MTASDVFASAEDFFGAAGTARRGLLVVFCVVVWVLVDFFICAMLLISVLD